MTPSQIKRTRKRLGLSREDFASRLGFTGTDRRITIWRWETGNRKPSRRQSR